MHHCHQGRIRDISKKEGVAYYYVKKYCKNPTTPPPTQIRAWERPRDRPANWNIFVSPKNFLFFFYSVYLD